MAQRTSNLYRLVTIPRIYSAFQELLGGVKSTQRFIREIVRPAPGMTVLDVGCGPAPLFPYLQDVDYTGIDLNQRSIDHARALYGNRGRFFAGDVSNGIPGSNSNFDLIIVSGLLHHLDDDQAGRLFASLVGLLKPLGRIVTFDNVWLPRQNPIAKLVNALDSGMNVRTPAEYVSLLDDLPLHVEQRVYRDMLRIPYDHFCMTLKHSPSDLRGRP